MNRGIARWLLGLVAFVGVIALVVILILSRDDNRDCGAASDNRELEEYSQTILVFYESLEVYEPLTTKGPSSLYSLTIRNDGVVTELLHEGRSQQPHMSPGGGMVYLRYVYDQGEDYILHLATGALEPLLNEHEHAYSGIADWSPDGKEVLIASDGGRPRFPPGIYTVSIRTGRSERIRRTGTDKQLFRPRFSPDGTRIAFFAYDSSEVESTDGWALWPSLSLRVACADGSHEIQIAPTSLFNSGYDSEPLRSALRQPVPPKWSPRGNRILFHAWFKGEAEGGLYIVDVYTSNLQRVTSTGDEGLEPFLSHPIRLSWSPGGDSIAYSVGGETWVQAVDGTYREEISGKFGDPSYYRRLVGWTHAGQVIALAEDDKSSPASVLFLFDPETGEVEELVSLDDGYVPSSEPVWIP